MATPKRIDADETPTRSIECAAGAKNFTPPIGHVGRARERMLDQDDVVRPVEFAAERAENVIAQGDFVHCGTSFRAEFADIGMVQRGGGAKWRGVRHNR